VIPNGAVILQEEDKILGLSTPEYHLVVEESLKLKLEPKIGK